MRVVFFGSFVLPYLFLGRGLVALFCFGGGMAFTDQQKVDIRRFCGFPVFGGVPTQAFGHRFFQWYGTLEFRMNNLDAAEEATVIGTYLANLSTLELAVVGASANLDTEAAAVWKRNPREVADRLALFDAWRLRLCAFFGVGPGPEFGGGRSPAVVV